MIRIGKLRQRVTWQKLTSQGDEFNTDEVWTDQATYWAQVTPLSALETIYEQAQEAIVTHQVTMRWVGNIAEADRLSYLRYFPDGTNQTVTLEITSVLNTDELNKELVLLCREVR